MSEDTRPSTVDFDTEAFGDWVEETADNKGISRSEVLDRMLSSYWILEELTGMMDAPASDGPDDGGKRADEPTPVEADEDRDEGSDREEDLSELIREFQTLRSAVLEGDDRTGGQQDTRPPAQPGDEGVSTGRRVEHSQLVPNLQRTVEQLSSRVEALEADQEALGDLESELEAVATAVEALDETVADEKADVTELASDTVRLAEEQTQIQDALKELRGKMAQLEDAQRELSGEVAGLRDAQAEREEMIEDEFDGIERVFQHLIDKTEDLEYRVGAITESHGEDLAPIEGYLDSQERLEALKREAQELGISTATCDNCGTNLDISLLDRARCPSCERTYADLEQAGRLPFRSHTFVTGPPAQPREHAETAHGRRGATEGDHPGRDPHDG